MVSGAKGRVECLDKCGVNGQIKMEKEMKTPPKRGLLLLGGVSDCNRDVLISWFEQTALSNGLKA